MMGRRVEPESFREVPFGSLKDTSIGSRFPDNTVRTSKYTLITFLPKNLFEQLQKAANFYFTILSFILFIGEKTNLYMESLKAYSTFLTLAFMMSASAVMAALDDYKRHKSDVQMNNQLAWAIVGAGEVRPIPWAEVRVGDVLLVKSEEEFPGDLMPLCCSGDEGHCYVSTANLDGETNLKLKAAVTSTQAALCDTTYESHGETPGGAEEEEFPPLLNTAVKRLDSIGGVLTAEPPQASIHMFTGTFRLGDGAEEPLGPKQLLLRGTVLRNTAWVIGVIVYTGKHTRVVMNSRPSPMKLSNLERVINVSMLVFLAAQAVMALITDIFFIVRRDDFEGYWYLFPEGSGEEIILPDFIGYLITFFGLYSNLIPISLYFTCEMCNAAQAFFITNDLEMYDEEFESSALARSTNLCQEIGQVVYIFSDKTGTLTQNVMELKMVSIAGSVYGKVTEEKGFHGISAMHEARQKSMKQREAISGFLEVLSVSHTVMATLDQSGHLRYEAESPDEDALVTTAAACGWRFLGRTGPTVQVEVQEDGKKVQHTYTVLALNAFTSARKRMSVVVRREAGDHLLLVKGADNVMVERSVGTDPILENHLTQFAQEGLRTLVIGRRVIPEDMFTAWLQAYEKAQCALEKRDEALAAAAEMIEDELELLGATAIEDKLQVGVGQTIMRLRTAGIKLWVLTGDKLETARNIGFSTKVLSDEMEIFTLDTSAATQGADLATQMDAIEPVTVNLGSDGVKSVAGMMVTGTALEFIIGTVDLEQQFLRIGQRCSVVIACRVSPLQKAMVVKLVRTQVVPTPVTLAVGDGANDVPMIQEAQVGVGICGREGRQAVNAADFAIAQFRFLQRLLLVHGRLNYRRACKFTLYTFWRNAAQVLLMFFYSFMSGYSGISLFEDKVRMCFNLITSLPVIATGMFDRDVSDDVMLEHPTLYEVGRLGRDLNPRKMAECLLSATLHSVLILLTCLAAFSSMALHGAGDYYTWGTAVYTCLIAVCCYRVAFITLTWNWICVAFNLVSVVGYIFFLLIYGVWKSLGPPMYSVPYHMSSNGPFWFALIAVVCLALSLDSLCSWVLLQFLPDPRDLIVENIATGKLQKVTGLLTETGPKAQVVKPKSNRCSSYAFDHPCEVPRNHQSLKVHPKAGDTSLIDREPPAMVGRTSLVTNQSGKASLASLKPTTNSRTSTVSKPTKFSSATEKFIIPDGGANKPSDFAFAQQKLPSRQFELTAWGAVVAPSVAGFILLVLGLIVFADVNGFSEVRIVYDGKADNLPSHSVKHTCAAGSHGQTTSCTFSVNLPNKEEMKPPILISYSLEPFYQNYHTYVLTVVNSELEGKTISSSDRKRCKDTKSDVNHAGQELVPCGLQATSLFNDTFEIVSTSWNPSSLPISRQGTAWESDKNRFDNPKDYPGRPSASWLYMRYPTLVSQTQGVKDEHFATWMRPQALPSVQKPYGYLRDSSSSLPAGQSITIRINSSFPLRGLQEAKKEFVLTERRTFGGKYSSMWFFLIVFGALILVLGLSFAAWQLKFPRALGDPRFSTAIL